MTTPPLAVAALLSAALAWRVRRPRQWALASTLVGLLAVNVWRYPLQRWITLDLAAFCGWYAITAGGVWAVLARRTTGRRWPVPAGSLALLVTADLALRFDRSDELCRASFALSLAAQILTVARFASRGVAPDGPQRVALLLALSSLASGAGPWLFANPWRDWRLAQWISVVTWVVIGGGELLSLLRKR